MAETLALVAYARDSGLDLDCELYCDSTAALGIAQRVGIGKVRHLRTQGLWVQEVRVSGRIVYKKVLGEKNPADVLTKHMSAESSARHLATLNMKLTSGRAESAPTLDSLVQAWHTQSDRDIDESHTYSRRVRFSATIECRSIPAEGKGRRTPARGAKVTGHEDRNLYDCEQGTASGDRDQPERDTIDEYICGASGEQPKKERWADWPSDEDADWMKVARTRGSKSGTEDRESSLLQRREGRAPETDL